VANSASSSITVLRDTLLSGVEERQLGATGRNPTPTIVRGVLYLPRASSLRPQAASLLDISGRKVMDLEPGANDVRALAPGVYFVRPASSARREASGVTKVILTE
jgi:hypothetical protein